MPIHPTRRTVLLGLAATTIAGGARAATAPSAGALATATGRIAALEKQNGGRLGVAVIDTASTAQLLYRADERFPMCSTFKLLASAAVLAKVDAGSEHLDRVVPYGQSDLLNYAPVTKPHVGEGGMPLGDLCAAAIDWSDNTAANLILADIGGPAGWTSYVRSLGDTVSRLDRNEPTLNTALPGDPRDTTAPLAMARNVAKVVLGEALSATSRQQLTKWIVADKVADARIRAGVPKTWRVGDKTGTGDNGTANTIGMLWPPDRAPIAFAVYYTGSTGTDAQRNAVHKEVGAIIAETFGS
jgi:beta-lactamase class A